MDNGFDVKFLRRNQREAFVEIKTHLIAENTDGARACAVGLSNAVIENMPQKRMVLVHDWVLLVCKYKNRDLSEGVLHVSCKWLCCCLT